MNSEFSLLRKSSTVNTEKCLISTINTNISSPSSSSSSSSTTSSSSASASSSSLSKNKQTDKSVCESFEMNDFRNIIKFDNSSNIEPLSNNQNNKMVVSSIIDTPPTSNPSTNNTEDMKNINESVNSLFIADQPENQLESSLKNDIQQSHEEESSEKESSEKESSEKESSEKESSEKESSEKESSEKESSEKESSEKESSEKESSEKESSEKESSEKELSHNDSKDSDLTEESLPEAIESDGNISDPVIQNGNIDQNGSLDDSIEQLLPFPLLPGEILIEKEEIVQGMLYFTNYRFYVEPSKNKNENEYSSSYPPIQDAQLINFPLAVIDSVETRYIHSLVIFTKYVQSIILSFNTFSSFNTWYKRFTELSLLKLENNFCFQFYKHLCNVSDYSNLEMLNRQEQEKLLNSFQFVKNEFDRMRFDPKNWRICELNREFKFSSSYPQYFIVPNDITDKDLEFVANFRYTKRIPTVVWRSKRNGCVIVRSSQPIIGWLGWRCSQDERLLQRVMTICNKDVNHFTKVRRRKSLASDSKPNGDLSNGTIKSLDSTDSNGHIKNGNIHTHETPRMLILDARSYATTLANRAIGGGCECTEYYSDCEIQFMGLANIHAIRKSYQSVRDICETSQIDQFNWYTLLDNTKWFLNLSVIIKGALVIVDAITVDERPVLIHCTDGWDRTPQVVALAELMLDPFYRTIEGFNALIQREWLDFGHKFTDRNRSSIFNVEVNERCPVFLQWLDCVYQLLRQYPTEFEFNEHLLVKLVHHTYSGLFGTFTCNSAQERYNEQVHERTVSFWAYVENERENFINYLYLPKQEVIRLTARVKDLGFWNELYSPVQSPLSDNISINDITTASNVLTTFDENNDDETTETMGNSLNNNKVVQSEIELQTDVTSCLSQSKTDLTRAASFDSLNKLIFDSPNSQTKKLTANNPPVDSECRLVKHLSDTCLYDPNDGSSEQFNIRSTVDMNEERPFSGKISDDSSCDDNMSTKNDRRNIDERSCDGGTSPKPNSSEVFDIDGELSVADRSNTQIQQMIIYHRKMIQNLTQQLQQNGRTSSFGNRINKVYTPEDNLG